MTTTLLQLARSTQTEITTLQAICDLLGINAQNNQVGNALVPYVTEVCRLAQEEGLELEDAVQQVLNSMPAPESGYEESPPNQAYSGKSQDSHQVAMAIRGQLGDVLSTIQQQGNSVLTQLDQHIIAAAEEFTAQVNARPNLFWAVVAEKTEGKSHGPQISDLIQRPLTNPAIGGTLNRQALSPLSGTRQQQSLPGR